MDQGGQWVDKAERPSTTIPETGPEKRPDVEVGREGDPSTRLGAGEERRGEGEKERKGEESVAAGFAPANLPAIPAKEVSRDPLFMEAERKLEDGLWDAYKSMSPGLRAAFKAEGERIAAVAREGIRSGRLAAETLLQMIVAWLRMIPQVNRWFLVQDAKLKTDALIRMVTEHKGE